MLPGDPGIDWEPEDIPEGPHPIVLWCVGICLGAMLLTAFGVIVMKLWLMPGR